MFQNAAIDVGTALVLMYLMLGLLCTVINEFIATKLKLRAKSLGLALQKLLDNEKLRETFYRHGLIVTSKSATKANLVPQSTWGAVRKIADSMTSKGGTANASTPTTVSSTARTTAQSREKVVASEGVPAPKPLDDHPNYLSSRNVALALIGSLDPSKALPAIGDIRGAVENLPNSNIRDTLLSSLTEAGNDVDRLRTSIATWFDDSMERLSGAYKRQLKWISMLVGLVVAILFNADSFNVAATLWNDADRRALIVALARDVAQESFPKTPESVNEAELEGAIKKTEKSLRLFPIGWNCAVERPDATSPAATKEETLGFWGCAKKSVSRVTAIQVFGWILTATALTLGAPFWFDLLQKFVNIRGAGDKPKRADEKASV